MVLVCWWVFFPSRGWFCLTEHFFSPLPEKNGRPKYCRRILADACHKCSQREILYTQRHSQDSFLPDRSRFFIDFHTVNKVAFSADLTIASQMRLTSVVCSLPQEEQMREMMVITAATTLHPIVARFIFVLVRIVLVSAY